MNDTNLQSDYICNECRNLEKQIDQLKAENERLISLLTQAHVEVC